MSEECEKGTNLVKDERGNAGRNERVSNPDVPGHPLALEPTEVCKVYVQASIELRGGKIAGRANKRGIEIEGHGGRGGKKGMVNNVKQRT
jgi:hypothetical protein